MNPASVEPSMRSGLFGAACMALQPLALNAISIPVMAYIIRALGPSNYGQWATSAAIMAACMMLANLGLRGSFVRRVATHPESAQDALAEQLGLRLVLALLAAAVAIGACAAIGYSPIVLKCTIVAAIGAIFLTVATTLVDLFQSLHGLPTVASVNLIAGLLLTAASVLVIWLGGGPIALSVAYLIGPLSAVTLFAWTLRKRRFALRIRFDIGSFWRLLRGSRSFTLQQIVTTAGQHAHGLLLSRIVSPANFAFFSAGSLPGNRLTVIPDSLCCAAYPAVARAYRQSPAKASRLVLRYLTIMLLACIGTAVAITLVARPIAHLLFPNQWEMCYRVIQITIWVVLLSGIEWIMGNSLNAAGKEAQHARASLVAGPCALVISVILVVRFGVFGACFASLMLPAIKAMFLAPCFARTFMMPAISADVSEPLGPIAPPPPRAQAA